MAAKIILRDSMSEDDFVLLSKKWEINQSITIESQLISLDAKKHIFSVALNRMPNSFAEAVVDVFLEDEDFPIDDVSLIKCIENGSYGLKQSVFYRKKRANLSY